MSTQIAPSKPVERSTNFRSWMIIIITNLVSLICMAWVLNGANLSRIWIEVQHMHWAWVSVAVASNILVFLLQGWRWKLLLAPIRRVPFSQTVEAIYVGLFANEVLPFRAGELIRCFLLSKSSGIPLSVSFASALIERIFDGIWLMACFFASLHLLHAPGHMRRVPGVLIDGGYTLGILIVVCAIIIGCAMYAKQQSLGLLFGLSWPRWFNTLIEDLHLIGHSRYLYFAFLVSGVFILGQILPIYALVRANRLTLPWTASFAAMVFLRLSSIVPQAPGNLGSYQWVAARSLMLFGLPQAHAKRFSMILWGLVTLPLIVIGFVALALEGINISHLHKEASEAAQNRDRQG